MIVPPLFDWRGIMPFLTIKTNAAKANDKLAEKAADILSQVLQKPLKVIAVSVEYNKQMAFDGSEVKIGAWIELASIGFKDKAKTVQVLTDWAVDNLGAEKDLVCIRLDDLNKTTVAHGGCLLG